MASTFFVLPARDIIGNQFANFLNGLFPGLYWSSLNSTELADTLTFLAESQDGVFVVHNDELAEDADLELSLVQGFGAERGDLVVEVGDLQQTPPVPARLWRITLEAELDASDTTDEDALIVAFDEE